MDISILSKNFIKNLSSIPGILGFCNINDSNKELKDSKTWGDALSITTDHGKANFNISIIISVDSTINNIAKQIKKQATFDFKNNELKINNINIYINGVK
ncbi:MAG: hypothetical protein KFW07_02155 [Mycoplasmataceae bacterium]|nr:hypothetical protein [Mycoplasmataceae bacterium]